MKEGWRPKQGDKIVRHPRQEAMSPVRFTVIPRRAQSRVFDSPMVLIYAFLGLIVAGTVLLLLPISHNGTGFTPFVDALFTATSAVTVTGLVTQDTAVYWSKVGQVFILSLMFVGGLGFMTIATFLLILIGHRVTLKQRLLVRESLGVNQLGGLVRLTIRIVLMGVGIQVVGFVALLARFLIIYPAPEAIWQALFHAVSGFNNAGFEILPDPEVIAVAQPDYWILGIIGLLVIVGSISYWVLVDIVRFRRFSLFSLNTKLVLVVTIILIVSGGLLFFSSEYSNDKTLGPLPVVQKILISLFESISGRTAGFSTVNFGETEHHTNFFFTGLMFIGGASASVAGGIKVNTIAVILVAVISTLRGKNNASVFGREIPQPQVQRAMTIGTVAVVWVCLVAMGLNFSENSRDFRFIDLMFEGMSAFGTVGLSTGIISELSRWGHLVLVATMFIGRTGPLTLGLLIRQRDERDIYRFAQERVTIG